VFGIEITVCPHCGGRLRVIADVTDPAVIDQILRAGYAPARLRALLWRQLPNGPCEPSDGVVGSVTTM